MEDLILSPVILALLFFGVALAYSSVGLGGGTSYTALMAIFGVSYVAIPTISLVLNLLVTFIGSVNFFRQKHMRLRLLLPFVLTSVPMSYVGGSLKLPKEQFYWILIVSLLLVAVRIYCWENAALNIKLSKLQQVIVSLFVGAVLGLIAGVVGIGGGIYLVPLVIILGLGTPKEAAAAGTVFIWVNSLAGLAARFQFQPVNVREYLPLIVAVVLGGSLGSYLGSSSLKPRTMEKILGGVVLIAIGLLARKLMTT